MTRTATAEDGGVGTAVVDGVMIDLDAPTVAIGGVGDGATYALAVPRPTCEASDETSGVADCELTTIRRGLVTTVTATATDVAGRTATATATWRRPAVRVGGAPAVTADGRYVVERGTRYRLVALPAGSSAPRLLGPVRSGAPLPRTGAALARGRVVGGLTTWSRGFQVTSAGRDHRIALRVGDRTTHLRLLVR